MVPRKKGKPFKLMFLNPSMSPSMMLRLRKRWQPLSIATGAEPEEEESSQRGNLDGLSEGQLEVIELVRRAEEGLGHIRTPLARNDVCLACYGDGHGTFECRRSPASPDSIALGMGLLESFFQHYRPYPRFPPHVPGQSDQTWTWIMPTSRLPELPSLPVSEFQNPRFLTGLSPGL